MTSSEIDRVILRVAQPSWRKVAMVVATAAGKLGPEFPMDDRGRTRVARRLEALVRTGQLVAQGDITKWRHSEVRLPGPEPVPLANECVYNLRRLDGAKQMWALENQKNKSDVPTWADLRRVMRRKPVCPEGGTYTLGPVGEPPKCSIGTTHTAY